MWTFQRYAKWLENRTNFFVPGETPEPADTKVADDFPAPPVLAPPPKMERKTVFSDPLPGSGVKDVQRIEIDPDETGFGKILKKPE
jgi:hypothetical protein